MKEFIERSTEMLDAQLNAIELSIARLEDRVIWKKVKPELNSIGNLCLHLAGSEFQHIVSGIGGKPFIRERSNEFLTDGGYSGLELVNHLKNIREQSKKVLFELSPDELSRPITIHYPQGANVSVNDYTHSCLSIILFVLDHSSYHTGQIVYMTKIHQDSSEHILKWRH
ncbi:DinB family protein [Paenibacillus ginsengarvi]|uniref:DUF1572 domain-containing protein n=1 Tax=Paenibacillus ginsengarvi TaxID=400777 RepID=A0A3B0CM90_9BACL|nr:DUF1572 family protein [Paenibacillus ginsengarvi]RKN85106.1 DUF1572 domain-containing protein [Paenibacillus ginsengarvi]